MDQTLLGVDIVQEAQQNGLLDPFEEEALKGASYDIRAGYKALVALPPEREDEQGRYVEVLLPQEPDSKLRIEPAQTVVVFSLEKVKMPLNMKGRLSLRSYFSTKGLNYAGGIIDPGYQGYLFFNIVNLANSYVEIQFGERLVTAEFIRLAKPASEPYAPGKVFEDIPDEKKPPLPPRGVYDPLEVSAKLDALDEDIKALVPRDQTLLDKDIEALGEALIEPFERRSLKGASYDIRVGSKAVLTLPETEKVPHAVKGRLWISLSEQNPLLKIPPAHSVTIYSLEKVNMPLDMKGRLSIRSKFMVQRLNYDGGVIDPGYKGRLFFTVANLGDSPVEIRYGEPIVTAEFVRLPREAVTLFEGGRDHEEVDEYKLPPLPAGRWYDLVELSKKVDQLEKAVKNFEPTQQIMNFVFLAAFAGIVAGLAGVLWPALSALGPIFGALLGGVILGLAVVGGFLLGRRR